MKMLILSRYQGLGASSRLRLYQYIEFLEKSNFDVDLNYLTSDKSILHKYKYGKYKKIDIFFEYIKRINIMLEIKKYDIVWIEKEALPWIPSFIESIFLKGVKYIVDYDDAVFHNYDMHRSKLVSFFYKNHFRRIMRNAKMITAGNRYLAEKAESYGAKNIEILPTVIDIDRYSIKSSTSFYNRPVVVWIGSPSTVKYLEVVRDVLVRLNLKYDFLLRVIGADFHCPEINLELLPWSEDNEVELLRSADIGIMPLFDSPWEKGKCGYKLIQYMACGIPVIASPVGVNSLIVDDQVNGYLCNAEIDWYESLEKMLGDVRLREEMGKMGRRAVEERYCVQVTAPSLIKKINRVLRD